MSVRQIFPVLLSSVFLCASLGCFDPVLSPDEIGGVNSSSSGTTGSSPAPSGSATGKRSNVSQTEFEQIRASTKKIVLALHQYFDAHGKLPPAYTKDENGNPLTSWRVLILPQLGHQDIYSRYDQSKPWDSPENLALSQSTPGAYLNPAVDNSNGMTSFKGIAGPGSAMSTGELIGLIDIKDGLANTGIIVDDVNHPVTWTKPEDLDPAEFLSRATYQNTPYNGTFIGVSDGFASSFGDDSKQRIESMMYHSDGKNW